MIIDMKISWGIIGTGSIAHRFVEGLEALPSAQLYAVSSRSSENANAFSNRYKIPHVYDSVADLLNDSNVDVVYIGTPNDTHSKICLDSLNAGKHVLCEKPFAIDSAQADEVIQLAKEKKLFCMEAMWMRFIPSIRTACQMIREGEIGEIRVIEASLGFHFEGRILKRILSPVGGGVLLDLAVYPLSLIIQLLGRPEHISSQLTLSKDGIDVQAVISMSFTSGAVGSVCSSIQTQLSNSCWIHGTKGSLFIHAPLLRPFKISLHKHPLLTGDYSGKSIKNIHFLRNPYIISIGHFLSNYISPIVRKKERTLIKPYWSNGYQYQAMEVIQCISQGVIESKIMPLRDTLEVLKIIDDIRANGIIDNRDDIS